MNIRLAIATATPELFYDAVEHALRHADGSLDVLGLGNGCTLSADQVAALSVKCGRILLRHFPENRGVPRALHELWAMDHGSFADQGALVYIHDDLRMLEPGWDTRLRRVFDRDPRCGLVGFGGATALAGDEIYKVPYEIHQLGRRDFYSNMVGAEVHGIRTTEERPIVFTDGQSMIVTRSLLDRIGGWSWWPFDLVHHAYDYGIACMARRHGFTAWLVPCHVDHLGGQTGPLYQELAQKHGGDAAVHAASHRFVYDHFSDVLPLRL